MTEADTADLVARAAAGEEGAFDLLVRGHHTLVFRWALVVANDPDDADDLAQAVWVKAHRNIRGFRGDAKFTSWLYRITYTTGIEFGRKRQRRVLGLERLRDPGRPTDETAPAGSEIDTGHFVAVVRSLLEGLPARQRAVFALADLEDRSTAEIAEMLDIEEATVRVTLFKARRAIRSRMLQEQPQLIEEFRS